MCLLCSACTVAIFDVVTEQLKHTWSSDEAGRPGARAFVSRLPRRSIHTCHRDIGPPTAPLSLSLFFSRGLCPNRRAASVLLR